MSTNSGQTLCNCHGMIYLDCPNYIKSRVPKPCGPSQPETEQPLTQREPYCGTHGETSAPLEASARERAIKEKLHEYIGSDSLSDCWAEIQPLFQDALAAAYRRGQEVFVEALDHTHGWCLEVPEGHIEQRIIGCWCGEKLDGLDEFNAHLLRALPVESKVG